VDVVERLKATLCKLGHLDPSADWRAFAGGRTNRIWQVGSGEGALVCKLFQPQAGTVLFPNDFTSEVLALQHLQGTGLAPDLITVAETPDGPCILYRFVSGTTWAGDPAPVGAALSRLHQIPEPTKLRRVTVDPHGIVEQVNAILQPCPPEMRRSHMSCCPSLPDLPAMPAVFLHGDAVPANIICTADGPTLIDWQCPAIGDPCHDLAVFLSPAMQTLYGRGPLNAKHRARFIEAYGTPGVAHRLALMTPLFHWQMAGHCLAKAAQGDVDYAEGYQLEMAALQDRPQPDRQR